MGLFQSTCSVRSKTDGVNDWEKDWGDFNPLAPCGARPAAGRERGFCGISIHLLRAEQDGCGKRNGKGKVDISIHLLRAEQDSGVVDVTQSPTTFQSTCSVRSKTKPVGAACQKMNYFNPLAPCGARHGRLRARKTGNHFNPLAPCGARHAVHIQRISSVVISIHLLRAEQDIS